MAVLGEEPVDFLQNAGFVVVTEAQRPLPVELGGDHRAKRGMAGGWAHGATSSDGCGRCRARGLEIVVVHAQVLAGRGQAPMAEQAADGVH